MTKRDTKRDTKPTLANLLQRARNCNGNSTPMARIEAQTYLIAAIEMLAARDRNGKPEDVGEPRVQSFTSAVRAHHGLDDHGALERSIDHMQAKIDRDAARQERDALWAALGVASQAAALEEVEGLNSVIENLTSRVGHLQMAKAKAADEATTLREQRNAAEDERDKWRAEAERLRRDRARTVAWFAVRVCADPAGPPQTRAAMQAVAELVVEELGGDFEASYQEALDSMVTKPGMFALAVLRSAPERRIAGQRRERS